MFDARRDVYWLLAGERPEASALRANSARLGLDERVVFTGFRADVPEIMAADLLVVASVSEGCCAAILEAMACGRAVVATRVGGTPEVIEDRQTGLIVEPRRADKLAAAILELAGAPERRAAMGTAGARRVREVLSVEGMVRKIEGIYVDLAGERRSG